MKYILTESQFALLSEDIDMQRLKRRMTYDSMVKFIHKAEIDFPTLCDDFSDEFEYADNILSWALDEFIDQPGNEWLEDRRDDLLDYVSRTNLIGKPYGNDLKERKMQFILV